MAVGVAFGVRDISPSSSERALAARSPNAKRRDRKSARGLGPQVGGRERRQIRHAGAAGRKGTSASVLVACRGGGGDDVFGIRRTAPSASVAMFLARIVQVSGWVGLKLPVPGRRYVAEVSGGGGLEASQPGMYRDTTRYWGNPRSRNGRCWRRSSVTVSGTESAERETMEHAKMTGTLGEAWRGQGAGGCAKGKGGEAVCSGPVAAEDLLAIPGR